MTEWTEPREGGRMNLIDALRGKLNNCNCGAYGRCECCCGAVWPEQVAGDAADEIERLTIELNNFKSAVEHVTEGGKTTRSVSTSDGWAMVHKEYLLDLATENERLTAERDALAIDTKQAEAILREREAKAIAWVAEHFAFGIKSEILRLAAERREWK